MSFGATPHILIVSDHISCLGEISSFPSRRNPVSSRSVQRASHERCVRRCRQRCTTSRRQIANRHGTHITKLHIILGRLDASVHRGWTAPADAPASALCVLLDHHHHRSARCRRCTAGQPRSCGLLCLNQPGPGERPLKCRPVAPQPASLADAACSCKCCIFNKA